MNLKNILFCLTNMCFFITYTQSFDIYDNRVFLKDYDYNLTDSENNNFYNFPKTVKIKNTTNELLDPIIQLHSSEKLEVSFDILSSEYSTYAYTFIHCDSDWNYSDINQSEYLSGFFHHYIDNYIYSFNTITNYCHYKFEFPNENIGFEKSGNYIILIYDDEKKIPVTTKRFLVYEDLLDIELNIKTTTLVQERDKKQEIDFYVKNHNDIGIKNPHDELKVILQKNDDWNDIIKNCKPSFFNKNILEYDYQDELCFLGGNEYREFDMKSFRYYGKNIKDIEKNIIQNETIWNIKLYKDNIIDHSEYQFQYDLNGKYITSVSERKNKENEAEYGLVKFTLNHKEIIEKNIFIYGELTNWDILPQAKMNYNQKENEYYGFLYLKQGYYNYQYVTINNDNIEFLDANYRETRNQYSIYIYYSPKWSNFERLIGVGKSTSNTLN